MKAKLTKLQGDMIMSNHPSPPNLFHYGYKELSQDAMICWTLAWADKECAGVNTKLHEVGKKFARALFAKHNDTVSEEIFKVVVKKQVSGIDVLVTVNEKFKILIEDKTDSSRHDNQLVRYHEMVLEKVVSKDNFFPIFLKTGNMSMAEEIAIETVIDKNDEPLDPPYRVFNRADFIDALLESEGVSEILDDFVCYLKDLEDDFNSWNPRHKACKHPEHWTMGSWQGFYRSLENQFDVEWGYVHNRGGGFLGLWWSEIEYEYERGSIYLQIESEIEEKTHVAFKIAVEDELGYTRDMRKERRINWRIFWHNKVVELADKNGIKIVKPDRFGYGRTMTVAVYKPYVNSKNKPEWRVVGNDKLDYDATIEALKNLEKVLHSAVDSYEREVSCSQRPEHTENVGI